MKTQSLIFLLPILCFSCSANAQSGSNAQTPNQEVGTKQDTLDILAIYRLNIEDKGDLRILQETWSADARWVNAFGRVFTGRDTIMNWLDALYRRPGYAASYIARQDDPEIRFLRPDVVIVHEYHEREGQIINDQVTPTRKIHSTYLLTKENGKWLIRDKVTMDERARSQ